MIVIIADAVKYVAIEFSAEIEVANTAMGGWLL